MRYALAIAAVLATTTSLAPAQDEWNPIADYNAEIEKIPENERAWPVYVEALELLATIDQFEDDQGMHPGVGALASDPNIDWESLATWLRRPTVADAAAKYREAASLDHLGRIMSAGDDPVLAEYWRATDPEYQATAAPENPLLVIDFFSPHLGLLRKAARHLHSESSLYFSDSMPDNAVSNLVAAISISQHASSQPFLICQLVQLGILDETCRTIREEIWVHPNVLSDAHLLLLTQELVAASQTEVFVLDPELEILSLEDLLRRSANSHGFPNLTHLEKVADALWGTGDSSRVDVRTPAYTGELKGELDTVISLHRTVWAAVADSSRTPWNDVIHTAEPQYSESVERLSPAVANTAKIFHIPWQVAVRGSIYKRTAVNATLLALTLHRHHFRNNAWPETLDAIDPDLLAELTPDHLIDPFTGEPLFYKLTDAGPIIYSAGADRDDDNARQLLDADGNATTPRWIPASRIAPTLESNPASIDGDWILYPPQN